MSDYLGSDISDNAFLRLARQLETDLSSPFLSHASQALSAASRGTELQGGGGVGITGLSDDQVESHSQLHIDRAELGQVSSPHPGLNDPFVEVALRDDQGGSRPPRVDFFAPGERGGIRGSTSQSEEGTSSSASVPRYCIVWLEHSDPARCMGIKGGGATFCLKPRGECKTKHKGGAMAIPSEGMVAILKTPDTGFCQPILGGESVTPDVVMQWESSTDTLAGWRRQFLILNESDYAPSQEELGTVVKEYKVAAEFKTPLRTRNPRQEGSPDGPLKEFTPYRKVIHQRPVERSMRHIS